ncbi:MDR family MFS transporter [Streptomyces violascens]|uniref:MFS transporter n=1 Tax=Streptomyces violascens TaxID=67381 RepID=A0ABQ3QUQ0_9ACTN|nr:MDR family MFS transporter [Streptomyces violascens]GGU05690.1 MFS transporter [Streptomyces violascens]GHI40963.1 MFS transporter [Streptomyces violascens]
MSASVPEPAVAARNVRWALLGVMLAMLLSMLDNMVVGTAMPTIVGDLGGLAHIAWVVTAYTLATAASTPVWGKFGDLYGRKHMYLASVAVFVVGSALSGAAHSMTQLIAFRVLQGLGAGGIGAGAFALIASLVPPRERGRYQGMTASVMAIGTVGGPLLGGFVTGHIGWRWAFYLNLPLGVVAFVWCLLMLHLPAHRSPARVDWRGITLLTATICALVLAATWAGSTYAWISWQILGLFALAAMGTAAFIASQRRAAEPVLPLRVFTGHRNFPLASALILVAGVVMFGCALYLPLFQQTVQGASAADSGLLLLPMMIPVVLVSQLGGRYMSATGRYKIFPVAGAACMAAGLFLLSTMDVNTSRTVTSCYMALVGIGLGAQMQMVMTMAQNSVEMRDMGAASASMNLFRTIGGSLGVAVFGSLFTGAVTAHLPGTGSGSAPDADSLASLPVAARDAYLHAVTRGTHQIFLTAAVLCAAAFVAALCVKEVPLRGKPQPVQADAQSKAAV